MIRFEYVRWMSFVVDAAVAHFHSLLTHWFSQIVARFALNFSQWKIKPNSSCFFVSKFFVFLCFVFLQFTKLDVFDYVQFVACWFFVLFLFLALSFRLFSALLYLFTIFTTTTEKKETFTTIQWHLCSYNSKTVRSKYLNGGKRKGINSFVI